MIADIGRHRFIRHGAAFLALCCPSFLHAAEDEPIVLIHADQVSLERADPGNVALANGNVHFRQGRSELFADEAIWFEDTDEIHLFGHVKVLDTLETLHCDTLIFISKTDIAFARGNVEYHRPASDLVARSKRGEYDRTNRTAVFYEDAVMYYQASDSSKQIVTTADTLRFEADSESGEAIGHVQVERADGEIRAKNARFITGGVREQIEFVGEPEGTFNRNDIAGDTVVLNLLNDELETLDSRGNARAVFRESSGQFGRTTESNITSDHMVMYFDEGVLREVEAIGQAKSSYVPATGHPDERNDTSGDTVRITIVDSTVQRVQVIGGAAGTYFSPKGDTLVSVTDTIVYQSSYIDYRVDQAWIRLWDHADLTYGEVNLTAGQVLYQTEAAVLRAYALDDTLMPPPVDYRGPGELADSLFSDSLGPADTVTTVTDQDERTIQQLPVLRERTQIVYGDQLVYDIQTQRGRIVQSSTQAQDGFYRGGNFRLEAAKTFYVENGQYTTCELDTPHFGFTGGKMKVREKDRVVARPVVLRIEQIPVLWIPYYVFSIKDDRHSGMLPLRFGNFERGSRYLRNIGYYFAVSDHFDFAPAMDIVEGEGVLWHMRTAYAWRYKLSGAFFGSYGKHTKITANGEQTTSRWNMLFSHNQQISPSVTLSGSGNFISDNSFYQDFTADPNFRLNRRLRSQINLNKRWTSSSLILALDDSRNLDDDSRSSVLPRYALSIPQRQLFAPRKLKGGKTSSPRWFHNIRGGFNSVGQHLTNASKTTSERAPGDTVNVKFQNARVTMNHAANLNYSGKAGPFTLNPSVRLQESWYYIFTPTRDTLENGTGSIDDSLPTNVNSEQFYRRLSGSFSIGSQTNLYGIFNLNRGNINGFRHVFTPSVTFSFSPAVTQNQEVRNYTGVGGGGTRSAVMGMSIGNLFQMKTQSGDQEKRWDLLNIGIGTSYNFEAKTRKWSNITTSIRSGLVRNPDISISMVHDPYDLRTGELDITPRLASISTAVSFRLTGRGQLASGPGYNAGGYYESQGGADFEGEGGTPGGFSQTNTKVRSWDFSAQYQFSEVRSPDPVNPGNTLKSITHWIRPNLRFNPTPGWDVQTNLYYDIRNQTMNDWTIRLQRDLHCWQAEFSWVVTGARAGYYFRINVKRISSLKFEKSESGLRDALFGALPGT